MLLCFLSVKQDSCVLAGRVSAAESGEHTEDRMFCARYVDSSEDVLVREESAAQISIGFWHG